MAMKSLWLASLMPAHGTTCQTWEVRCTQPLSHYYWVISILRRVLTTTWRPPLQRPTALQKRHHLRLVMARRSSRAGWPLAFDTTNTSGKYFTTWIGTPVAVPVQLYHRLELYHSDLQAWPEGQHLDVLVPWRQDWDFHQALLRTTTLIAYDQYDNLVVVNAYRTVTFDNHAWCSGGYFRRPSWGSSQRSGQLVGFDTREEPFPIWFPAAYLINTPIGGTAGEHWESAFLEDSQHTIYFESHRTALLWRPVLHIGDNGNERTGHLGTGHWLGGGPLAKQQHEDVWCPGVTPLLPAVYPWFLAGYSRGMWGPPWWGFSSTLRGNCPGRKIGSNKMWTSWVSSDSWSHSSGTSLPRPPEIPTRWGRGNKKGWILSWPMNASYKKSMHASATWGFMGWMRSTAMRTAPCRCSSYCSDLVWWGRIAGTDAFHLHCYHGHH